MVSRRAAMILAAGASQRMRTPKALWAWRGSTLLHYAIDQARLAGAENLVVVLGPATQHLVLDVATAFNPDPETGRSASIRLGASALPDDVDGVIVQSVDQPVPADVLIALYGADAEVVVPTYQGRRGHPVCFAGHLLPELREINEVEMGLRAVVRRHTVCEVPVDTEAVLRNLNDPAAYAAAQAAQ